jgi:hypothetical protein
VVVEFTFHNGRVSSSAIVATTLNNAATENCIAEAIRRWEFPMSESGMPTTVRYPFTLTMSPSMSPSWLNVPAVPTMAPAIPRPTPGPWEIAVAAFRAKGDLSARIEKVAQVLAVPGARSPAVFAWWLIDRRLRETGCPTEAYVLTASLLREAGLLRDARRVLSEAAPLASGRIQAEFRSWGLSADAERLGTLATRH